MNKVNVKSQKATTKIDRITKVQRREPLSAREKRARFAAVISDIPEKKIAAAADCTVQAVRKWKSEEQFLSGDNLIDLAQALPEVRNWLVEVVGFDPSDPRVMDGLVRASMRRVREEGYGG